MEISRRGGCSGDWRKVREGTVIGVGTRVDLGFSSFGGGISRPDRAIKRREQNVLAIKRAAEQCGQAGAFGMTDDRIGTGVWIMTPWPSKVRGDRER